MVTKSLTIILFLKKKNKNLGSRRILNPIVLKEIIITIKFCSLNKTIYMIHKTNN